MGAWEESLRVQLRHHAEADGWETGEWRLYCFDEVESTMDEARHVLSEVSPETPGLITASRQSRGRGRQGRTWEESGRAFFGTFIFASRRPPAEMTGYSLVVGCGVRQMLGELGCEVGVKWPNDILTPDGRKVGGILIEQVIRDGVTFVLTGIGMNLDSAPEGAACVSELTNLRPSPLEVAARLFPQLFADFCRFREQGFDVFRDRYLAAAMYLGSKATIDTGGEQVSGVICGVGDTGTLLLETEGGVREIISGHFLQIG